MSDKIAGLAVQGYRETLEEVKKAVISFAGSPAASGPIAFPDTNYNLPLSFSLTGKKITALKDVQTEGGDGGKIERGPRSALCRGGRHPISSLDVRHRVLDVL